MSTILNASVKEWYLETFPDDKEGNYIRDFITFDHICFSLAMNYDIYNVIGVEDSTIRERIFLALSGLLGTDYEALCNRWLDGHSAV